MKKAVSWLLLLLIVLASPTQAALLTRNWAFDHSLYKGKNRLTGHNDQNDNITNDNGTAFTSNGADQLTKAGSTALAYNGSGQATSVGQLSMKFAYNDQIKSITGRGLNAAYLYDGNGQRVQKTVNGTVQNFLWNGGSIAKEYKPDGSVRADYQLGTGAKIDGKWQFYLSDIQGSTLGVADDTGKVIATWSYSDYGVTTQTSGDKGLYQPFLYTHSELDSETGFYHNKARHYAPKFGKFLARDPIASSSNLYSYCDGDPIDFSDPSGLESLIYKRNANGDMTTLSPLEPGAMQGSINSDLAMYYFAGKQVAIYYAGGWLLRGAGAIAGPCLSRLGSTARLGLSRFFAGRAATVALSEVAPEAAGVSLEQAANAANLLGYNTGGVVIRYAVDYASPIVRTFTVLRGFYAEIEGQPTIALTLDGLSSLRQAVVTIAHELVHAAGGGEAEAIGAEVQAGQAYNSAAAAGVLP